MYPKNPEGTQVIVGSRYYMISSHKYNNNNIFKIMHPEKPWNHEKTHLSSEYPQAGIGETVFVASLHNVLTSEHHTNEKSLTFVNSVNPTTMETKNNQMSSISTS